MATPEEDLALSDTLLNAGDAAGALRHARRAQESLAANIQEHPLLLMVLACRLIDAGGDLGDREVVREGLAVLETNYEQLRSHVKTYSLHYNIGNAKKALHDLDLGATKERPFNASAISLLTEAKDHYWQAYRLLEPGHSEPVVLVNLANALDQCCRVAEALRWYGQALLESPGFPMAHLNRAQAILFLNNLSGSFSVSQLAEARRSFRLAETAPLSPKLSTLARDHCLQIGRRLEGLGWSEARIAAYDDQHLREAREHDPYWNFCLDNYIALNEHALYCRCAGARRDDLAIPTSSGPVGGPFIVPLELLLNRVKSEFCLARALYFQAMSNAQWDLHPFEGTFSELDEHEAIGLQPEFLRTAFRLCFGVLDRLAKGLAELYDLAARQEALHFESFWRPPEERRRKSEIRWGKINAQENPGLVALFSIATDLNRDRGQWGFFKEHRNHLEHELLVLLPETRALPEAAKPKNIALKQATVTEFAVNTLQLLQLTASAIFSFTFCVRIEGRRHVPPAGRAVRREMAKKRIGKD